MPDGFRSLSGWTSFAGSVLVVAVLYWAQAVLVPVCLAILLTFVLGPPVTWLQRRIGRVPGVLAVVVVVFTFLGLGGYAVYQQMVGMADTLPTYRANIRAKMRDVRWMRSGGSVEKIEKTLQQIQNDFGTTAEKAAAPLRVRIAPDQDTPFASISWLGPIAERAGTVGFVATLVLFMLLEREDLRDRLIGIFGRGHLATTTRAIDEAGQRVSRQLLLQTVVNLTYGLLAVGGLSLIGVPYALFWGALGAALRFIPYLGPILAAGGPILVAFAALPGWTGTAEAAAFYVALELFTNLVLETVLYAGAAGVSQVALLVAVAFWTWLWGPLGLVLATPLTVCVVVIGKHVRGLGFLSTLMSDVPALPIDHSYYQRVLAGDHAEAAELIDRYARANPPDTVYDAMLVPALNYAERDRVEGRLSAAEEVAVSQTTAELLEMLSDGVARSASAQAAPVRVLGYAIDGGADLLALRMLDQLLAALPIVIETPGARLMASELVDRVKANDYRAVCIADLPPSAPSRGKYLVKRLRGALPDLRIVVGRWAPTELADVTFQPLTEAGASYVASTLIDTRNYLAELMPVGTAASAGSANSDAA
jgi:predicted PurR-regulated permease PerM